MEKKRKNSTVACIACRNKHIRCVGGPPCDYCISNNKNNNNNKIICEFPTPNKRGPNRNTFIARAHKISPFIIDNNNINNCLVSANSAEVSLWYENEKLKCVDLFFNMRNWYGILLDKNLLTRDNKDTQVQLLAIGAFISRYNSNFERASDFYKNANMLAENLIANPTIEGACSLLLLFDYMQPQASYYINLAWKCISSLPIEENPRNKRLFVYIKFMRHFFCNGLRKINDQNQNLDYGASGQAAGNLWDIVFAFLIRIFNIVFKNNSYCYNTSFFDALKRVELTQHEIERALQDLNLVIWILECNLQLFGHEYIFYIASLRSFLLWTKGDKDTATADAVKLVCKIKNVGQLRVFLVDLLVYSIPLLVLQQAGMINVVKEGFELLSNIAFATEQYSLYTNIYNYFFPESQISSTPITPSPSPTNLITQDPSSILSSSPTNSIFSELSSLLFDEFPFANPPSPLLETIID